MVEEFEVAIWEQHQRTKEWGYKTLWRGKTLKEATAQLAFHKGANIVNCVALFWR